MLGTIAAFFSFINYILKNLRVTMKFFPDLGGQPTTALELPSVYLHAQFDKISILGNKTKNYILGWNHNSFIRYISSVKTIETSKITPCFNSLRKEQLAIYADLSLISICSIHANKHIQQ